MTAQTISTMPREPGVTLLDLPPEAVDAIGDFIEKSRSRAQAASFARDAVTQVGTMLIQSLPSLLNRRGT